MSPSQEPTDDPDPDHEDLDTVFRRAPTQGRDRLPWSFATLSVPQRHELAARLDRFAGLYNRWWAGDGAVVPPCWYRHPALAHDLAALAWAHHEAYRDPSATAGLALRFQEHLPRFAERLERWLAPDPAACRAGHHPHGGYGTDGGPAPAPRRSVEARDRVVLLGDDGLRAAGPPGRRPSPGR